MDDLLASSDIEQIKSGDVVEGVVTEIKKHEMWVDLGANGSGVVSRREITGAQSIKEGDNVTVSVVEPETEEGHALLSMRRAAKDKGWEGLEKIQKDQEIIDIYPYDANRGGLLIEVEGDIDNVLYITISTGIGTGIITNGIIDPSLADTEGGQTIFRHNGKLQRWEKFASGKAIVKKYGKKASEITDEKTWKTIARDLSLGFLDLAMIIQPDVIIVGGGVGSHFEKFKKPLLAELKKFETPLAPIPPIKKAKRPEEAVIYGCYELAKDNDNG